MSKYQENIEFYNNTKERYEEVSRRYGELIKQLNDDPKNLLKGLNEAINQLDGNLKQFTEKNAAYKTLLDSEDSNDKQEKITTSEKDLSTLQDEINAAVVTMNEAEKNAEVAVADAVKQQKVSELQTFINLQQQYLNQKNKMVTEFDERIKNFIFVDDGVQGKIKSLKKALSDFNEALDSLSGYSDNTGQPHLN